MKMLPRRCCCCCCWIVCLCVCLLSMAKSIQRHLHSRTCETRTHFALLSFSLSRRSCLSILGTWGHQKPKFTLCVCVSSSSSSPIELVQLNYVAWNRRRRRRRWWWYDVYLVFMFLLLVGGSSNVLFNINKSYDAKWSSSTTTSLCHVRCSCSLLFAVAGVVLFVIHVLLVR